MKKTFRYFGFMVFVTMIMAGCNNGSNSVGDDTQKPSELPTFEELVALNRMF